MIVVACRALLFTALVTSPVAFGVSASSLGEQLSDGSVRRLLENAGATATEITFSGKPIPFSWGAEFVTTLEQDAARYETELSTVLSSPLSDWEVVSRDEYTLAARPIILDGAPNLVTFFSAQYTSPSGRGFFDFLVSDEGFVLLDPDTEGRSVSETADAPSGATAFASAHVSEFTEASIPPAINVVGRHWQFCGPDELTLFNYPAGIPVEDRSPDVAAVSGTLGEWTLANSVRVAQVDPDTIEVTNVLWSSLTTGLPPAVALATNEGYYLALHARITSFLEANDFEDRTGEECAGNMVGGMKPGVEGYGYGYGMEALGGY